MRRSTLKLKTNQLTLGNVIVYDVACDNSRLGVCVDGYSQSDISNRCIALHYINKHKCVKM